MAQIGCAGIRLNRMRSRGPILVPMTFDRHDYLEEISSAIRKFDADLRIFCLVASLETIQQRLRKRGALDDSGAEWVIRRSAQCVIAHRDPAFGQPIDTEEVGGAGRRRDNGAFLRLMGA